MFSRRQVQRSQQRQERIHGGLGIQLFKLGQCRLLIRGGVGQAEVAKPPLCQWAVVNHFQVGVAWVFANAFKQGQHQFLAAFQLLAKTHAVKHQQAGDAVGFIKAARLVCDIGDHRGRGCRGKGAHVNKLVYFCCGGHGWLQYSDTTRSQQCQKTHPNTPKIRQTVLCLTMSDISFQLCPPNCANCGLRKLDAFTTVSVEQLKYIEAFRSGVSQINAGGTIIYEDRPNGKLFTVYTGWAFRYKTLSDGRRQILNFLLPGDLIGLQQEFADGAMHGIDALTDVSLCVFPRDGLFELFREYPSLGYDVTWLSAREESMVDDALLSAGRRNAAERVAVLLMHLYKRMQRLGFARKDEDGGSSVDFPINQQHIADALGLSLVHTNKTLRRLQHLGLHRISDGRLRLLNTKALQRIADYYEIPPKKIPLL